jgi:hypothetical protein
LTEVQRPHFGKAADVRSFRRQPPYKRGHDTQPTVNLQHFYEKKIERLVLQPSHVLTPDRHEWSIFPHFDEAEIDKSSEAIRVKWRQGPTFCQDIF